MPFDWQTIHIPFASGFSSKEDPRALEPPALAVCLNADFDESGGLQSRLSYGELGTDILGGGTISNARKIVANGNELLLFTKTALYSWGYDAQKWVLKDTYLAPTVDEESVFVRVNNQTQCDRAELSGVVVYAWLDAGATSGVYVAALDEETGAVLQAPTLIAANTTRPRLVALASVILLFFEDGTDLCGQIIDPANLATSIAAAHTSLTACNAGFDVARCSTVAIVACRLNPTTSYSIHRIDAALGITSSAKARSAEGPIAVAVQPDNARVQLIRWSGTTLDVEGDYINATTLADVTVGQTILVSPGIIGTAQITAAYRPGDVAGVYTCVVFWSDGTPTGSITTYVNTVTSAGVIGTAATFKNFLGVASRAFGYEDENDVFVWLAFDGASSAAGTYGYRASLQNTYFLYREDGLLVAKATGGRGGGNSTTAGHLPNVQETSGLGEFAWCGVERRVISVGIDEQGYAATAPRDIHFTFDDDAARRCVRLGQTLYITGGQILQYDGVGLTEVGFHVYPWELAAGGNGAGNKTDPGTFTYKATLRWDNAKGELDRSTTATTYQASLSGFGDQVLNFYPITATLKRGDRGAAAIELWATLNNPVVESPFYLVSDKNPATVAGDNRYVTNTPDAGATLSMTDALADTVVRRREINPENGSILENLAPPPAKVIAATHERIFLAGVAGDPDRVWYSKLRGEGEVAAFHDALTIDIPHEGGDITALALLDGTLIVFRERAIYSVPGDGFDNAGGGQNYGPPRCLSSDTGAVSAEGVGLTPEGLVYKSNKGWHLLQRNGVARYIGAAVKSLDDSGTGPKGVHTLESKHQIRCLISGLLLVYDYLAGQWSRHALPTAATGRGATIWDGTYHYVTTTDVLADDDNGSEYYSLDVETAWIKLNGIQGYGVLRHIMVLGDAWSACDLRARIAYDYETGSQPTSARTWVDDVSWTVTPEEGRLQVRIGPSRTKCQAFKLRLTTYEVGSTTNPPDGQGIDLTALSLEIGVARGLYRGVAVAQKVSGR